MGKTAFFYLTLSTFVTRLALDFLFYFQKEGAKGAAAGQFKRKDRKLFSSLSSEFIRKSFSPSSKAK
jgi:hypothetical protein